MTSAALAFEGQWTNPTPVADLSLPPDYVGDFAVPLRRDGCPVVRRRKHGHACPPVRCGGRRCTDRLTCSAHKHLNGKARLWAKGGGG